VDYAVSFPPILSISAIETTGSTLSSLVRIEVNTQIGRGVLQMSRAAAEELAVKLSSLLQAGDSR